MLEARRDQAAGLLAWQLQAAPRVLAVVASPRGTASCELLWRLQLGCRALGLDGSVLEGPPGAWDEEPAAGDVWLWHATPDQVARCWPPEARPLVALDAQPAALVGAYQAIKQLRAAVLAPAVVALPAAADAAAGARSGSNVPDALTAAVTALRRTCERYLQWCPTVWWLGYHARGPQGSDGVALEDLCKVLEMAWVPGAMPLAAVEGDA
jgi:hypothetical protein